MQAPDLDVLLDEMIACGRECERRMRPRRTLSVLQPADGAGGDTSRARTGPIRAAQAPAISASRRRADCSRVTASSEDEAARHGTRRATASTRLASDLARRAHGRPAGAVPKLLGALSLRRRLPLRSHSSRAGPPATTSAAGSNTRWKRMSESQPRAPTRSRAPTWALGHPLSALHCRLSDWQGSRSCQVPTSISA